jgi:alpha-glucoside transport system substrate-binding protein
VPTTWDEMIALSDQIVADGNLPWCAGIESGAATGWVMTDWIEDAMLRTAGPEAYDQWVAHEIPFNGEEVTGAAELIEGVILNPDYVGDVQAIATTTFQNGGLGLLDGSCWLHRQASFYGNQFPEDTVKGPDGDISAFFLPMLDAGDEATMLGGGELIAMFNDRPEVRAVVDYLTSVDYANSRGAAGNWLSSNRNIDTSIYTDPLEQEFATLLKESPVFRFDASDLMPAAVGAGTFWTEMTSWVNGDDLTTVLDNIEASWPA